MNPLGVVLPTPALLEVADAHAARMNKKRASIGSRLPGKRKIVCGENRYYQNAALYVVVGRDLRLRWFETRADGNDYAIKEPK